MGDLGVEKMEVVDLRERSGVLDTRLGSLVLKVAVNLDGIFRRSKVGVDGVSATGGSWVLKPDILA